MITIITPTFNSENVINDLCESLSNQDNKKFRWIVIDACSNDRTIEIVEKYKESIDLEIIVERDLGIYDAINKGVIRCRTDYYMVVGSDDFIYSDTLSAIESYMDRNHDLISGNVDIIEEGRTIRPRGKMSWLYGASSFVASHSAGLVIKKELHNRYGFYNLKFPIVADQLFVMSVLQGGGRHKHFEKSFGAYSLKGTSGSNFLLTSFDFYRMQLNLGKNKHIHTIIYILRLLKFIFFK
jgi:glycosyltransferase involved in cell wall biosynthesis